MIRLLSLVWRLCVVLIAFVAAVFCATLFLAALLIGGFRPQSGEEMMGLSAGLLVAVPVMTSLFGYLSFVPAMGVILFSELAGKRDWLFHVLASAAIALMVMVWQSGGDPAGELDAGIAAAVAAAGMIGGWVYWLFAGRRAGVWQNTAESGPENI